MVVYTQGTARVVLGRRTVEGTGTTWVRSAVTGGLFTMNGLSVPIASVETDTGLTLTHEWPSEGRSDVYSILLSTAYAAQAVSALERLNDNLEALRGLSPLGRAVGAAATPDAVRRLLGVSTGRFQIDATGTLAQRSAHDAKPAPFTYYATDTKLSYVRQEGGWSAGLPVAKGEDGREVEFRLGATGIEWRYVGSATWNLVAANASIKGADGREAEFRSNVDLKQLQWRWTTDAAWTNLLDFSLITGPQGDRAQSSQDAVDAAARASTSEGLANSHRVAAAASATSASGSASTATSRATAASGSATASANSATASANSATASANSATAANSSANAAAGSATAASGSATASANSATASAGSATAASGSASGAAGSASAAATARSGAESAQALATTKANESAASAASSKADADRSAAAADRSEAADVGGHTARRDNPHEVRVGQLNPSVQSGPSHPNATTAADIAEYRASGSVVGAIVFAGPNSGVGLFHMLEVEGFNYVPLQTINVEVTGYRQSADVAWAAGSLRKASLGSADVSVRFGVTPDGRACVVLGDVDTSWNAPHLSLARAKFGLGAPATLAAYAEGWTSLGLVTDLSGYGYLTSALPNVAPAGVLASTAGSVLATHYANLSVGTSALAQNAVTLAKMANVATQTVLGRSSAATGAVESLTMTQLRTMLALTASLVGAISSDAGSVLTANLAAGSVTTPKIAASAVTFNEMQNVGTGVILGRSTTGTGNVEALSVAAVKALLALTFSDVGAISSAAGSVLTANLGANSVTNAKIAANAVTFTELQNVATGVLLGRSSASTGNVETISMSTARTMLSINNVANKTEAQMVASGDIATALAARLARTGGILTGQMTLEYANPAYRLVNPNNRAWYVQANGTNLRIVDETANAEHTTFYGSGEVSFNAVPGRGQMFASNLASLVTRYGIRAVQTGGGTLAMSTSHNVDFHWNDGFYYRVNENPYVLINASASDATLKELLGEVEDGLSTVLALNPVWYEFKKGAPIHVPTGKRAGFLAQHLERVLPELVRDQPVPDGDGRTIKVLVEDAAIQLIAHMAASIEELHERIKELEDGR